VAVKVLAAALADDPDLRPQIRTEARTAAGLRHANVVAVFDYGEFGDAGSTLCYVVMELVDGRSLADMLTAGALPWRLAVLIGAQAAAALAAAHGAGIVHRDVKPANVMVTATGVKLVDFGISAAVGELDRSGDGQVLGTPAYLAPERMAGAPVRPATDVYALGLLLYRSLCGRMPWNATTVTQMVRAHVHTAPAPMPDVPGLPAEVTRLVARCLAKKPGERPSSIEVAEVLGELAGLPPSTLLRTAAERTVPLPWTFGRRSRRSRRVMAAAAASAALLALGGTWWALTDQPGGPPAAAAAGAPVCPAGACPASAAPSSPPTRTTSRPPSPGAGATPPKTAVVVPAVSRHTVTAARPPALAPKAAPAPPGKAKPPKVKKPKSPKPPGK
jgi:serine/threonine-protein kinase